MILRELSVEWSSTTTTSTDASVACEQTDVRAASSEAASLRTGMMIETSGPALIQVPEDPLWLTSVRCLHQVKIGLTLSLTPSRSGESFSPTYVRGQSW